jgi:hypothetical protein
MTEYTALRELLESFAKARQEDLRGAAPEIEERLQVALGDRYREVWTPLLAIADIAGGQWPKAARVAMETLGLAQHGVNEYLPIALLADIYPLFHPGNNPITGAPKQTEYLPTADLLDALREEDRWAGYGDQGLSKYSLARMLGNFGIRPGFVGPETARKRGYRHMDFTDAWNRYVLMEGDASSTCSSVQTVQPQEIQGVEAARSPGAARCATCSPEQRAGTKAPENKELHVVHVAARSREDPGERHNNNDPSAPPRTRPGGGGYM